MTTYPPERNEGPPLVLRPGRVVSTLTEDGGGRPVTAAEDTDPLVLSATAAATATGQQAGLWRVALIVLVIIVLAVAIGGKRR